MYDPYQLNFPFITDHIFVTGFHSYEVTFYLLNLSSANKKAIMNKNLCHLFLYLPLKSLFAGLAA